MEIESFREALGRGDFSEVYLEESANTQIVFEDKKVEQATSGSERGLSVRMFSGEETRFGSQDGQDPAAARDMAARLGGDLKKTPFAVSADLKIVSHAVLEDPSAVSLEAKAALLSAADRAARDAGKAVRQVSLSYGERVKTITILNSLGEAVQEKRCYVAFVVTVVAEENGVLQTATEVLGALSGFELFKDQRPVRTAKAAAERALSRLKAPSAPVGEMPVIIASSAGGTLIHEAIGHSLEADLVQKGESPMYRGKIGTRVANDCITVLDDPTQAGRRGAFVYDDEGTPSQPTYLIRNGILQDYLYDRQTARKDNRPSNGHGRRESYLHRPIPRMSNTFIAPGFDDPETVLTSVQNGLLVTRMGGGQVNTATGDFVFEVEEAFVIQSGKVGHLVRGASLLGNGPEILKSIDRVGSDLGWSIGTCGKSGQGVPVSDAVPTLRIPKILVGGM